METYNLNLKTSSGLEEMSREETISYFEKIIGEVANAYVNCLNIRKRIVELLTSAHLKGVDIGEYKRRLGETDAETQTIENDLVELLAFENRLKQTQPNKSQEENK